MPGKISFPSVARKQHSRLDIIRRSILDFIQLEDRWVPATISDSGTTLTISLDANEDFFVRSQGSSYRFDTTQTFSNGGVAQSGDFTGFGTNQVILNDLAQYDTIRIQDNGSNADVIFSESSGSYTDNFEIVMDDPNSGQVRFTSSAAFGASDLSITTNRSIAAFNSIISTTTGSITFNANRQATPSNGPLIGIEVTNSTIESTSTGTVTLRGRGGNGAGGFQYGILLQNSGRIVGGTSGETVIDGIGGASMGQGNYGISLQATGSIITSNGSAVSITGQGGGASGGAGFNYGIILLNGSTIAGSGSGSVSVTGTGGGLAGSSNHGITISGGGTSITSAGGAVTVSGTAAGTGNSSDTNFGVILSNGGQIISGGTGTVKLTGQGAVTGGDNNDGVHLTGNASAITSTGGNVIVSGTSGGTGTQGNNVGVLVVSGSFISAGGSGTVSVEGVGSASTGNSNTGVLVKDTGSRIGSDGGEVSVSGSSLGNGANARTNLGVFVQSGGMIAAGGNAKTIVTGTGGQGGMGFHHGVVVQGTNTSITSGGGDVTVNGKAISTTGESNIGVIVQSGGKVSAGGTGTVRVNGTGGPSPGDDNQGVFVDGVGGVITSTNGDVFVTGQAGGTGSASIGNLGILVYSGGLITAGPGGSVNLTGIGGNSNNQENIGVRIDGELGQETAVRSTDGPITITGTGGPGSGRFHIGVHLLFGGKAIPGGNGSLTIDGTAVSALGNSAGVTIEKNAFVGSSGGPVTIVGRGASSDQEGFNIGVLVQSNGVVTAGGNSAVTISGTGGPSTQDSNHGILINNTGTQISSSGGNVTLTGVAGGTGATSDSNFGIFVFNGAKVTAGGNGVVTLNGTGGVNAGSFNDGIRIAGSNSIVTSSGGKVTAIGIGGGTGASQSNDGVHVTDGGVLTSGGTGQVTVNGKAGQTTGDNNIGVFVFGGGSQITSSGGDVLVIGRGGLGNTQTNTAIQKNSGGTITATPPGTVTLDTTGGSPPSATLGSAPNVSGGNSGETTYTFTVTYTDNHSIDVSSIDSNDIQISGPAGFSTSGTLSSVSPTGNGTPRTVTYQFTPPGGTWDFADSGTYTIAMKSGQVLDNEANSVPAGTLGTFTVTIAPPTGSGPNPVLVGVPRFASGSDRGGAPAVAFYNPDGSKITSFNAFDASFTGGVRTASGDFNRDGVPDLVVGTGPGSSTRVRVLNGTDFSELFATTPFESSFTGGVYVAVGDVNGDGVADLAITPDEGGGPRVDLYSGTGFNKIASFFGIDDTNFRGGARAAIGDLSGDGFGDLIVVAGFGGGPRVAGFDGKQLVLGTQLRLFGDFFAFEQTLRNGIFVTVGDVNGDGFADLIAGGGPGGGPRVQIFSGNELRNDQYNILANFFGGDTNSRGGIRLAVKNLDNDTKADLVVGAGSGAGSRVTSYLGTNLAVGNATASLDFDSFPGFSGGVFVG